MKKRLSHTAVPSRLTQAWHVINPYIPKAGRYHVRRNLQYLHSRKLSAEDVMLLSYPKSGSTWLRSMLLLIASGNKAIPSQLAEWIPPLHMVNYPKLSTPRIVRSHDAIDTPGFSRAGKILVLVRDPRALVVSYHHHQKRRNVNSSIEKCTDELLTSGFDNIGSWQSHVKHALDRNERSIDVKILTYEALLENTNNELQKILQFYNFEHSDIDLDQTINQCTPENLRNMRISAGIDNTSTTGSDIRKASSKGWHQECPPSCITKIQKITHQELELLGYDLV